LAALRLLLFIDAQNVYNRARHAFFTNSDSHVCGQIKPIELGNLICSRSPAGCIYKLERVRIYTGQPNASKEPKAYGAHRKQRNIWEKSGAEVRARPLRYLNDWPTSPAQQKGVDVELAIDSITFAIDQAYDIGVIASTDTDLKPALEFVNRKYHPTIRTEVVAWDSPNTPSRISIAHPFIWCHWLSKTDYDAIADLRDYNL